MTRCADWDCCIAYDADSPECREDNGCMTPENIRAYLEWCKRAMENCVEDEEG